ncbi:hypothetical protein ABH966_004236 [Lysinibacillus sp. RC46]
MNDPYLIPNSFVLKNKKEQKVSVPTKFKKQFSPLRFLLPTTYISVEM